MKSMKQWMILFVIGFCCTAGIQIFAADEAGAGIGIESSKNNQIQSKSMMSRAAGAVSYAQSKLFTRKKEFITVVAPEQITKTLDEIDCSQSAKDSVQDGIIFLRQAKSADKKDLPIFKDHGILLQECTDDEAINFAQSVAKQAGVNCIVVDGSVLPLNNSQQGIAMVSEIFEVSHKYAPCVIGISAIDMISGVDSAETEFFAKINLFKEEMKSLQDKNSPIVIFAQSNYQALDLLSYFGLNKEIALHDSFKNEEEIEQCLQEILQGVHLSNDVNNTLLARQLVHDKSAQNLGNRTIYKKDLLLLLEEAQKLAAKDKRDFVTMADLESVGNTFAVGPQNSSFWNKITRDNRCTAIHEAGHAVAGVCTSSNFKRIHEATIIARGLSEGCVTDIFLLQNHEEVLSVDDYKHDIIVYLSGAVAEQVFGYHQSWGIVKPKETGLRQLMLHQSEFGLGVDLPSAMKSVDKILDIQGYLPEIDGEEFQAKIKRSQDAILQECYHRSFSLITEHKDDVKKVADLLLKKGTVSGDEIYALLNVSKPLYDFEQGPLPKDLVANYALRDAHTIAKKRELVQLSKKLQDVGMPYVLLQDINQKNTDGYTQLGLAIAMNNKEAVKLLLDAGADIVDINSSHNSALFVSIAVNKPEIVSMLLDYEVAIENDVTLSLQCLKINSVYKSQEEIYAMKNLVERYKDRYHAEKSKKIVIA